MKSFWQWIAFAALIVVLYIADVTHMATLRYNLFLIILFGMVTGLIHFLKTTQQQNGHD